MIETKTTNPNTPIIRKKTNMQKAFIFILAAFLLQSCGLHNEEQLITIEPHYSLSIPSFLTKADNLNDDASLQYQHSWREFYVIVIDEPKSDMHKALKENLLTDVYASSIDGYSQLILDGIKDGLTDPTQSELIKTNINSMPARITTVNGSIDEFSVFYSIGFYEGRGRYYQVITWTLSDKEDDYKDQMEKIIFSLKEL